MNRKSLLDSALGLCTVGGAIFAVGASKDPVSKVVVLPDTAFGILMVVGGVLAAAGAIAFMLYNETGCRLSSLLADSH